MINTVTQRLRHRPNYSTSSVVKRVMNLAPTSKETYLQDTIDYAKNYFSQIPDASANSWIKDCLAAKKSNGMENKSLAAVFELSKNEDHLVNINYFNVKMFPKGFQLALAIGFMKTNENAFNKNGTFNFNAFKAEIRKFANDQKNPPEDRQEFRELLVCWNLKSEYFKNITLNSGTVRFGVDGYRKTMEIIDRSNISDGSGSFEMVYKQEGNDRRDSNSSFAEEEYKDDSQGQFSGLSMRGSLASRSQLQIEGLRNTKIEELRGGFSALKKQEDSRIGTKEFYPRSIVKIDNHRRLNDQTEVNQRGNFSKLGENQNLLSIDQIQTKSNLQVFSPVHDAGQSRLTNISVDFKPIMRPTKIPNLDKIKMVFVGDLHGNFTKLLSVLFKLGIINISSKDYTKLVANPNLIENYIKNGSLTFIALNFKLEFAGDIFGDRNGYDKAKLHLLTLVSDNVVQKSNLKIPWSNHDEAFYQYLTRKEIDCDPVHRTKIEPKTLEMFRNIFNKHYTFFDYDDGENLFSHAPLSRKVDFQNLCKALKNSELNNPETSFSRKIEIINERFKASFDDLRVFSPYIWPRKKDWRNSNDSMAGTGVAGWPLKHYSGHDPYQDTKYNVSLDNNCGKGYAVSKDSERILVFSS
jgi:hypothetical protein